MGKILLEGRGVTKRFQGLVAIADLDFQVREGTICSLIGPNGAGKSTLFNLITGYQQPSAGKLWFKGQPLTGMSTVRINRLGIARAFQIPKPFHGLTVYENVRVGALFGRPGAPDPDRVTQEVLRLVGLEELQHESASVLTVGQLRQLELARALATRPELLLADEPCAGLNPTETNDVIGLLQTVRDRGVTVLLVEHDMSAVMRVSDWVLVLEAGKKIAEGPPDAVVHNERVIQAYLGVTTEE